jgi:hypothetical protein
MNEREIERWVRGRVFYGCGQVNIEPGDKITVLDMGRREVTEVGVNDDGSDITKRDMCGAEEMLIDAIVALVTEAIAAFAVPPPPEDPETIEKRRERDRERKAKRKGARAQILMLAHRDGFLCSLCGENMPDVGDIEVDHVVPVSKGGTSDPENLKLAHSRCNLKKGNRT